MRILIVLLLFTLLSGLSCPAPMESQPLRECLWTVQPYFLDLDALKELDNEHVLTLMRKHQLRLPDFEYVAEYNDFIEISTATEEDVTTYGFLVSTEDAVEVAACMRDLEAAVPGSLDQ